MKVMRAVLWLEVGLLCTRIIFILGKLAWLINPDKSIGGYDGIPKVESPVIVGERFIPYVLICDTASVMVGLAIVFLLLRNRWNIKTLVFVYIVSNALVIGLYGSIIVAANYQRPLPGNYLLFISTLHALYFFYILFYCWLALKIASASRRC